MLLETNLILSPKRGCFPGTSESSRDRLSWRIYGEGVKYLLEKPNIWFNTNTLEYIKERGIKHLERLDKTLELIRNYHENNKSDSWSELFFDDNKFPERADIHVKFLELTKEHITNTGIRNKKLKDKGEYELEYYKIHYNLIKDCRRVIDYILNDKPLYLIPEQVKIFKKFADILSNPPPTKPTFY